MKASLTSDNGRRLCMRGGVGCTVDWPVRWLHAVHSTRLPLRLVSTPQTPFLFVNTRPARIYGRVSGLDTTFIYEVGDQCWSGKQWTWYSGVYSAWPHVACLYPSSEYISHHRSAVIVQSHRGFWHNRRWIGVWKISRLEAERARKRNKSNGKKVTQKLS